MWHIGMLLLLLLAFDIEMNPGPSDACGICKIDVTWTDKGINCSGCEVWFHASCVNMRSLICNLEQSQVPWYCWNCGLPNFSSEIFSSVPAESIHPSLLDISRASSLSSKHSSQHQDLTDPQLNAHLTIDSPHTPPLFSTPAHSLSPPSFSSRR